MALAGVLVSPSFLFRVESDPAGLPPGTPYRISDLALASRLSFFLWSSIPDDELLDAAIAGTLRQPAVLEQQVRRMLADERSRALVTNFAAQWLHLRNLDAITPDMRLFPDFDDNLRQAFRQETELFFDSILREDRSALDLLRAQLHLPQRAAREALRHRARLRLAASAASTSDDASMRGGLLRQGSILTVTSYATRTSPVLRGKWVLDNLLGVPPPAPPPDVPALKDNTVDGRLSGAHAPGRAPPEQGLRALPQRHRSRSGFSLETFDAVGRRRQVEDGVADRCLRAACPTAARSPTSPASKRRCWRVRSCWSSTITEKLLTYALRARRRAERCARGARDRPRRRGRSDYRLSSILLGVVQSEPFQMRTSR